MNIYDAQSTLSFVIRQNSIIEPQVYQARYPSIQYRDLVPVDTSGSEFASSVTYFSADRFGEAGWINGNADDIPRAGTTRAKHETPVYTAGIGYGWGWEEVGKAMAMGINLSADDAFAARRAAEEMVDRVALEGDAGKGLRGLFDYTGAGGVTPVSAPNGDWGTVGAAGAATVDEIIADMNNALLNVFNGTNTVAIADTLLLPWSKYHLISTKRLSTDSQTTVLNYFLANNVYTATTGRPLTIRGLRGLDSVGVSATPRLVAYRNSPEVLKLHMPMPHRFLPVHQSGPLRWEVPGVMRLGGLDIRLPKEVTYIDGI